MKPMTFRSASTSTAEALTSMKKAAKMTPN